MSPLGLPKRDTTTLFHALAVSLLILLLFLYWFGIANRHIVFLYEHLGAGPFDPPTVSRYWMSGLVASGMVMVLYTYGNWFWGRVRGIQGRRYLPPAPAKVWASSIPLLIPGILWITTHLNWPVLPLSMALACAGAAAGGLWLALLPARMATTQVAEFLWLSLAGIGLVPALLLLRVVERAGQGGKWPTHAAIGVASTLVGALWTFFLAMGYVRWRHKVWRGSHLLVSSLCWSYLLLPLVHHILLTPPGLHYISVAENFFAATPGGQALSLLTAGGLAVGTTILQRRIKNGIGLRPHANPPAP
jgi:hypothetical protein